jgi:hypothetical protein
MGNKIKLAFADKEMSKRKRTSKFLFNIVFEMRDWKIVDERFEI